VARWRIVTRLHRLACYLLKGQPRRSGCAPMTSGLPRQEDKFRARRASHLCHQETYAPQQLAAHSITSSARASSGADRETKRLCRLQIGCQPEASREFDRQVAQCSAPLLTTAPPRHSGQGPWRQDCPRRRCSDRAGTATTGTIGTVADGTTPTPQLASVPVVSPSAHDSAAAW
jgi:hypothetical protein